MASILNPNDWKNFIPCDRNHNVPLLCQPKFKDLVTLENGVVLPQFSANPTGIRATNGSLYYNSTDGTLYYRNPSGFQALGVSGTPAPAIFPIAAVSASDADELVTSKVTPDSDVTWTLLADGTQQFHNGAGTLNGQMRYDSVGDQLCWEDTAGQANGTVSFGTAKLKGIISTDLGSAINFNSAVLNSIAALTTAASTLGTASATSLSTASITSPGSSIGFNTKSLASINDLAAVTGTFSTSLSAPIGTFSTSISSPIITTTGTTISVNTKSLSNINALTAVTGVYSTSLQTPSLTAPGSSITLNSKSLSSINDVGAVSGTYTTQVSTPKITSPTTDIDVSGKYLLNCGLINTGAVGTNQINTIASSDIVFIAGNGFNFDFTQADSLKTERLWLTGNNANTNRIEVFDNPPGTLPRVAINRDGTIQFTDGTNSIFGSQGFIEKTASSGGIGISFTKGAYDGTLRVGTITGPSGGLAIQAASGGPVTTFGALTNDTSFAAPTVTGSTSVTSPAIIATTSVKTPMLTNTGTINCDTQVLDNVKWIKQKFGGNTAYVGPIVIHNAYYFTNTPSSAGSPVTAVSFTIPANLLGSIGDLLRISVYGSGNGTTNARRIGFNMNGCPEENYTLQTGAGNFFLVTFYCRRANSTQVDIMGVGTHVTTTGTFGNTSKSLSSPANFTSAGTGNVTVTQTTAGDVLIKGVTCEFIPVP